MTSDYCEHALSIDPFDRDTRILNLSCSLMAPKIFQTDDAIQLIHSSISALSPSTGDIQSVLDFSCYSS
jgi:hypothetical protein